TSFVAVAMSNEIVRWVLVVLFAYLMICDLPMFSLKFKSWGVKDNALVYGFLLCSLIAIVVFGVLSLPFIILSYIVLSVLLKVGGKRCIE
ncbi:MAG: CDP-diacylglycerol--serine O-phosphatidyltransferase, partial [Rikenellaceae bacterium]